MRTCPNTVYVLSGKGSMNLAHALFSPTLEEMNDRRKAWESIENQVHIRKTKDGFEAEFGDLDLSFLYDPFSSNIR